MIWRIVLMPEMQTVCLLWFYITFKGFLHPWGIVRRSILPSVASLVLYDDLCCTVSCSVPLFVPYSHSFHIVNRSVCSFVPYVHLFCMFICSVCSFVPYVHLFRMFIRSVLSSIPCCHPFRTVIRSIQSSVGYCHRFPTFKHSVLSSTSSSMLGIHYMILISLLLQQEKQILRTWRTLSTCPLFFLHRFCAHRMLRPLFSPPTAWPDI